MTGLGTHSIEGDRRLGGGQFGVSGRAQHPAYRSSKKRAASIRVQSQGFTTRESREKRTGAAKAKVVVLDRGNAPVAKGGADVRRAVVVPTAAAVDARCICRTVGR